MNDLTESIDIKIKTQCNRGNPKFKSMQDDFGVTLFHLFIYFLQIIKIYQLLFEASFDTDKNVNKSDNFRNFIEFYDVLFINSTLIFFI